MPLTWQAWQPVLRTAAAILGAALAGLIVHQIFYWLAQRWVHRSGQTHHRILVSVTAQPLGFILPFLLVLAVLPLAPLEPRIANSARHFLLLCLIAALAWLIIRLVGYAEVLIAHRYQFEAAGSLRARRVQTQVRLFRRIGEAAIALASLAVMLMTFPGIWSVGASLLASAGVAGLIVGMAARPALSNLIAGVQVALTDPVRLGDIVIVEGEWGTIEELNTTYVVVKTWDLRRLIVPLSTFIEKTFQNWTRTSTDLMGTVLLYTDYTVPVEEVRAALRRIVEGSPLWDRKTCVLQVTDAKERAIELRALVSAGDSSALWDLRCHVREELVRFLQQHYPDRLPRTRAEMHWVAGGPGAGSAVEHNAAFPRG